MSSVSELWIFKAKLLYLKTHIAHWTQSCSATLSRKVFYQCLRQAAVDQWWFGTVKWRMDRFVLWLMKRLNHLHLKFVDWTLRLGEIVKCMQSRKLLKSPFSFISAPKKPCQSLGIKLPFLIIVVKNVNKPLSIEVQVMDDKFQLRRFRISSFRNESRVSNFSTNMPLVLNCGWNQIVLNLADFTNRVYQSNYLETVKITVNANCRLKNIYFSDRLYTEDEKPKELQFRINGNSSSSAEQAKKKQVKSELLPATSNQKEPQAPVSRQLSFNNIQTSENAGSRQRPPSQATQSNDYDGWSWVWNFSFPNLFAVCFIRSLINGTFEIPRKLIRVVKRSSGAEKFQFKSLFEK